MRTVLRKLLLHLDIPATPNLKNDILLKKILKRVLSPTDNAVDVGCHKGEILELIVRYAPKGKHLAIEPIPFFFHKLKKKFPNVTVLPYALSDKNAKQEFYIIKNDPAYSGLSKRGFQEKTADISSLTVETKKLDDIIQPDIKIKFIKIDVEGAELKVLEGGQDTIEKSRPIIAFEFGLGGSDYYGITPGQVFDFFKCRDYLLYDYGSYLVDGMPYDKALFEKTYYENRIYNFLAVPK